MTAIAKTTTRRPAARGRLADGRPGPIDAHVGARVRLRRTLLGVTQEKLGEMLGLTFQQVQKYERGANRVGASRLFDLSRALDVPIAFFFDDMPDAVSAASPSAVTSGAAPAVAETGLDPMARRESLELVRAYYRITDPAVRRRVLDLARALGAAGDEG
ncbi:MAG TPA: helix-turn-helix transcriptional regulator [Candidatus Omnitrophota bacterium]|nr:helix-turn-helix transcriptional regulator [Candidatus Omnitrophota bacterium]